MEKMIRTTLAALAVLTALTGCRHVEQEFPDSPGRRTVRFRAVAADTRTAFTEAVDGVYQTLWTENDSEILLSLNYGKAEKSAVTASGDGKTATFDVAFDAAASASPYTFYAVSPASAARAISPSRKAWNVYIAAEQTPSALSVDERAQLLVAKTAASATFPGQADLHFSHLTAYGRLTLNNLELGDATVRKAELIFGTPVVGEWYWGEDGTLISNGASHTITLNTDATGDLWFACAPVSVGNTTMKLNLYTSRGLMSKTITFPEGRSFSPGKVARFSIDMNMSPGGGDIFTLVTEESELEEGCEIIILNASGTHAMGADLGNSRAAVTEGFTCTANQVEVTGPQVAVITLEPSIYSFSQYKWSMKGEDGYLATVAGSTTPILKTVGDKESSATCWRLAFTDGGVSAEAAAGSCNALRYDPSSSRFNCYRSDQKGVEPVKIYKKGSSSGQEVGDNPLTAFSEYGCYIPFAERTYIKGKDQITRSYKNGKLEFVLMDPSMTEQLVVSGYDPALSKGDEVTVSVHYRKGLRGILSGEFTLVVVREDGPKVWLADRTGQGFILKK